MTYRSQHHKMLRPIIVCFVSMSTVAAASGCGFTGGSASSSGKPSLVFGGFGGSLQTAMQKNVIPAFEKKYGVDVTYVTGTSDELLAKGRNKSSGIDVMWTNDTTHQEGKSEGLFAKLNRMTVTNLSRVYKVAKDRDGVGVTTGVQALGLMYNTDVFKKHGWGPPDSWKDLFSKKFSHHIVGYNIPIGYANLLLVELSILYGGSAQNLKPGWTRLEQLVHGGNTWVSPPAQMQKLVSSGSGWLSFNGSSRAFAAKQSGDPVGFVYPKEGAIAYPQLFDVLKTAPHPKLAQKFVNFALSNTAQEAMAQKAMMGPVTKDVRLRKNVARTVPYGPKEIAKLRFLDSEHMNKNLDNITKRWTRLVGGS